MELTELQEQVIQELRYRHGMPSIARHVRQCWEKGKMASIDGRTPIPGTRRKFTKANRQAVTK